MNDVQWAFDELLRKTAEDAREDERKQAREDARKQAREAAAGERVAILKRHFEHRLARKLSVREDKTLRDRLSRLGADRLGIVVLDFSAVELARWLKDPAAR